MSNVWLIQNGLFEDHEEYGYESFIGAIDESGQKRIDLPNVFWNDILDLRIKGIDPAIILPFGTRTFAAYGLKNGWNVSWDHNYSYQSLLRLGTDFINHDMEVAPLDELSPPSNGRVFIRDASGWNITKGGVISSYAWPEWRDGFKFRGEQNRLNEYDWKVIDGSTLFAMAPIKPIYAEYRCWIINGKVVTASQYIKDGQIDYGNVDENLIVFPYAQRMADKIRDLGIFTAPHYVLDIFRSERKLNPEFRGLHVGEINCMHCSGWYAINSKKVVTALLAIG